MTRRTWTSISFAVAAVLAIAACSSLQPPLRGTSTSGRVSTVGSSASPSGSRTPAPEPSAAAIDSALDESCIKIVDDMPLPENDVLVLADAQLQSDLHLLAFEERSTAVIGTASSPGAVSQDQRKIALVEP